MSRGLVMRADSEGHLVIPLPAEIFGSIFSEDIPDDADLQTVMDQGVIQKWKTDLKIYIAHEHPSDADSISHLIGIQLKPLMLSVSEATGLGFKRVNSLSEANVVFIFAERSSDAENFLDLAELRKWFGARDAQRFDDIESAFRDAPAFCFRFTNAPENEITRAIGFTSTAESETVQEKCMARNLLFAVGLKGKAADSPDSAMSPETSSRSIGLLDEMALNVLYREGVEPGMTLRQALSK
ncbi:MAG: hypothetical protein C0484_09505 [Rhodospirillum sp.]|nr:hypothetical protein [Rhodospirillum sp.]